MGTRIIKPRRPKCNPSQIALRCGEAVASVPDLMGEYVVLFVEAVVLATLAFHGATYSLFRKEPRGAGPV